MEIYYFDHRSTNVSHVVPAITIPVALIVIISVIIALTKSSCPYVYILDDNEFKFIGEIYSGAIYPSLERDDYLALPKPSTNDGKYSIKIANKLPEVQYINLSELWFVQHQKNTEVLADRYGTIHTLSAKQQPSGAITSGGSDLMDIISAKDQNCFLFQEEPYTTGDSAAINSIIMTCDVPKETASAKLVVRAKNSYWGDYIFGEFAKLFGNKYDQWIKKRGKEPPDRPLQWKKDQNMVLMVYLETKYGWEFVDYFDMTGPLAFRDMVMPLGLEKAKRTNLDGKEQVRIKIQSGFMFWELDYAALDISGNLPTEKIIIHPTSAMNENGKNVLKLLSIDDERYYIQPSIGNETVLDFDYPSTEKSPEVSFILHTKGYYTHIRAYPGPPDQEQLETFREPGRMSLFSLETFRMEKAKTSAVFNESE